MQQRELEVLQYARSVALAAKVARPQLGVADARVCAAHTVDGRLLPRRVVDGPFDPNVVRGDRDEMRPVVDWDERGDCVRAVGGVDIRTGPAAVPLRAVNVEEESGLAVARREAQQIETGVVGQQRRERGLPRVAFVEVARLRHQGRLGAELVPFAAADRPGLAEVAPAAALVERAKRGAG